MARKIDFKTVLGTGCVRALALAAMLTAIAAPLRAGAADWSRDDAAHLLRRAGFGGTPIQIDRLHAMGRDAAVDYLIAGTLPDSAEPPFQHVDLKPFVVSGEFDSRIQGPGSQYELVRLREWWVGRMVQTDRPLEEKMSLFWHGLFTSGFKEVRNVNWMAGQNALFHKEAIGNYKRLTHEIIHDPAMLRYLNNDENLKGRPNENLARELMELFTMGEGNGYTEKDIPEVARALTGMTGRRYKGFLGNGGADSNEAQFVERQHDDGAKTIFGHTGNYKPDDVVDLIFDQPQPSQYLAKKLWIFFGHADPTQAEIAPVAEALKSNNWDVAPALRVLFTSPAFYSDQSKEALIKSPVELEVSALRLLEEPPQPRMMMASVQVLGVLGEQLFQPPNVKGWVGGERWITSSAIFLRYNLCAALANGAAGQNIGRFGGKGFGKASSKSAKAAAAEKQVALADNKTGPTTAPAEKTAPDDDKLTLAERRRAKIEALRLAERDKVKEELAALPPLPPPDQLVVPARLFATLGAEPTPAKIVDAAVDRFLQQPLAADKKAALVQSLGSEPLKLGEPEVDRRVRRMIGSLLSAPEFQVE